MGVGGPSNARKRERRELWSCALTRSGPALKQAPGWTGFLWALVGRAEERLFARRSQKPAVGSCPGTGLQLPRLAGRTQARAERAGGLRPGWALLLTWLGTLGPVTHPSPQTQNGNLRLPESSKHRVSGPKNLSIMELQTSQDVWDKKMFFSGTRDNKWQRNLEMLPKCKNG